MCDLKKSSQTRISIQYDSFCSKSSLLQRPRSVSKRLWGFLNFFIDKVENVRVRTIPFVTKLFVYHPDIEIFDQSEAIFLPIAWPCFSDEMLYFCCRHYSILAFKRDFCNNWCPVYYILKFSLWYIICVFKANCFLMKQNLDKKLLSIFLYALQ